MNFVFLSPNFPKTYYQFTQGLKNNGVTTLGIGDEPYDQLSQELKDSLVEYYKVSSLENYDEVYRACAFFTFKYGKIDWLESNNEYWLLRDAQLRTDFNITTGLRNHTISGIKYKSAMKAFYEKAGVLVMMPTKEVIREELLGYAALLPEGARCQFVMPNTPAMVREGAFLFEDRNSLTEEELRLAKEWFSALGTVEVIPTRLMGIASCVAGSAPAFVDMMMEGLSDAAVSCGMPRDMSYRLIAQMVVGSGRLLQVTGQHPGALKDAVCSPGGSTILGVEALDQAGFRAACQAAVHATMKRT